MTGAKRENWIVRAVFKAALGPRTYHRDVGVAFENKDNSFNILMNYVTVRGDILLIPPEGVAGAYSEGEGLALYHIVSDEKHPDGWWTRVGTGWALSNGGFQLDLDLIPTGGGIFQLREPGSRRREKPYDRNNDPRVQDAKAKLGIVRD